MGKGKLLVTNISHEPSVTINLLIVKESSLSKENGISIVPFINDSELVNKSSTIPSCDSGKQGEKRLNKSSAGMGIAIGIEVPPATSIVISSIPIFGASKPAVDISI